MEGDRDIEVSRGQIILSILVMVSVLYFEKSFVVKNNSNTGRHHLNFNKVNTSTQWHNSYHMPPDKVH